MPNAWVRWRTNSSSSTKRALVEQQLDALAGRLLALGVLLLDGGLAARRHGLVVADLQVGELPGGRREFGSGRWLGGGVGVASAVTPFSLSTHARATGGRSDRGRASCTKSAGPTAVRPSIRRTPQTVTRHIASTTIEPAHLGSPGQRSVNVIGTSTMRQPGVDDRSVMSIWKQ